MVEPVCIRDDSDMSETVQEHERAELVSLIAFNRLRYRPKAPHVLSLKIDSGLVKNAPYKS